MHLRARALRQHRMVGKFHATLNSTYRKYVQTRVRLLLLEMTAFCQYAIYIMNYVRILTTATATSTSNTTEIVARTKNERGSSASSKSF